MANDAARNALIEFAQAARHDQQANPAITGDGTALELLLAPRFQALAEALLAERFALPPRSAGVSHGRDRSP